MADLTKGFNFTNIGTVGTAVLTDRNTTLVRVIVPGTYVGSVALYNCSGTAGTSTSNLIFTAGIPATSVAGNIEIGASCPNGLTYASSGTPSVTIIWD